MREEHVANARSEVQSKGRTKNSEMKVNGNGLVRIYGEKEPKNAVFLHEVVSLPETAKQNRGTEAYGTLEQQLLKPS